MTRAKVYASVWDALADTPEQAANLRARVELMQQIAAIVKKNRWTQTEAAQRCGITQPRMNDLLRGRVSRFSLDALVNIATAIGRRVHMELESAYVTASCRLRFERSTRGLIATCSNLRMRRDCWYDGKLLNISERFVADDIDLRIFCYIFVYSAGVEPNAGIARYC